MKKTIIGILTLGVILSSCVITVYAAGHNNIRTSVENKDVCNVQSTSCVYTDNDESVANDVQEPETENITTTCTKTFVDTDNDGVCDNYVYGQNNATGDCNQGEKKADFQGEKGKNFVDADNDGICDNYTYKKCKDDSTGYKNNNGCQNGLRGRHGR